MRSNGMKAAWREGRAALGGWLSLANPPGAEAAAGLGFDYLCVDLQHGLADYAQMLSMLLAIGPAEVTPIVRAPWNEPGVIGRALDAGAMGVVIPMVNSADEAARAVSACRYAPAGTRSYGPVRAARYAGAGYFDEANAEVACIPMIETVQAVERLDEILDVEGIDAVYVGPADLAVSMGLRPGLDQADADWNEALRLVVAGCAKRGIAPGIHAAAHLAAARAEAGFRMITISGDFLALEAGMRADVRTARAALDGSAAAAQPGPAGRVY
ncbi:MAG: HpcH/HpaI aldolase family protein [Acidimicrobiales bacterium]